MKAPIFDSRRFTGAPMGAADSVNDLPVLYDEEISDVSSLIFLGQTVP